MNKNVQKAITSMSLDNWWQPDAAHIISPGFCSNVTTAIPSSQTSNKLPASFFSCNA